MAGSMHTLQPTTRYAFKSDEALKDLFHHDTWARLDASQRQDLLQEVVNREVAKNGGAYTCLMKFGDLPANTAGEQRGNTICLSRQRYVEDKLTAEYGGRQITYVLPDSNYSAYETVLHEHQHVKQDMIASGVIPADPGTTAIFQANGFTTSNVNGCPGSQYMLGVTDYSLYYLNPTELNAYQTSQTAARQLVAEQTEKFGADAASESYLHYLAADGYEAKLAQYRELYGNDRIDQDVQDVLVKNFQQDDRPVNPQVEKIVNMEMIESQKQIDRYHNCKESSKMAKQVYTNNGFTFEVEDNGTVTATGQVSENPASRNGMQSIHPNGYNSQHQDKGHLIAAREGGPAAGYNVTAQDRSLNRGAYKTAENAQVRLANEGCTVQTSKTAYVSSPGLAPDAYMINDTITTPDGQTQHVHLSFQNATPEEQQEWDELASQYSDYDEYPNPDPARESMTPEEYASLLDESDLECLSVRDEYDVYHSTETSFSSDAADTTGTSVDTSGAESGCDGGCDDGCDDGCEM